MKTKLLVAVTSILIGAAVLADSTKVAVSSAPTAAEQLARARQAMQQMQQAAGAQKMELFGQAWGNLALVRKQWANDTSAVIRSGIMQADLAAEFGAWAQAIEPLLDILPAAARTDSEAEVEMKLGQAYDQTGHPAEAEKHLLAAERALHGNTHLNRVEAEGVLSAIAMFYARQGNPKEAIQRFREAGNWPGQDAINKVHFQLNVAEQASRIGKDAAAHELSQFDDLVAEARRTNLSAADATLLEHMVQHAQRIRSGNPHR